MDPLNALAVRFPHLLSQLWPSDVQVCDPHIGGNHGANFSLWTQNVGLFFCENSGS